MQRWGDKQMAILEGDFVFIHLVGTGPQCGHDCGTIRQGCTGRNLGNPGYTTILGKTECVQFRNHLGSDKFADQPAERNASSFQVVHIVNREHPGTIKVALDRLVGHSYISCNISAVAGIVTKSLHGQFGDDHFICIGPGLYQIWVSVQFGRQGR